MAYFYDSTNSKLWASPYESYPFKKETPTRTGRVEVGNLPPGRWSTLKEDLFNQEDSYSLNDVKDWLRNQKIKYRIDFIDLNGKVTEVFIFKKPKDTILFKLTWG